MLPLPFYNDFISYSTFSCITIQSSQTYTFWPHSSCADIIFWLPNILFCKAWWSYSYPTKFFLQLIMITKYSKCTFSFYLTFIMWITSSSIFPYEYSIPNTETRKSLLQASWSLIFHPPSSPVLILLELYSMYSVLVLFNLKPLDSNTLLYSFNL